MLFQKATLCTKGLYPLLSALTAGQLSSTRKIWGHDFNGTQNVDGDIIINNKCTIKYDDTDKCIKFVFA